MPLEEADQLYSDLANKTQAFADNLKKKINPLNWVKSYDNIKHAYDRIKEIKNWFEMKSNPLFGDTYAEIIFTGKHTDIANIGMYANERMPCNELDNLDESIRKQTINEFELAEKDGYIQKVNIDGVEYYELTPKGKEHILSPEFMDGQEENQANYLANSNRTLGTPTSYDSIINMTAGKEISSPIIVCNRNSPTNYMEITATKKVSEKGTPYIETEYKVFNNNQQQTCSEFSHGRFTRYTNFSGNNTSDFGSSHWSSMRVEMFSKGNFSNDMVYFKNKALYKAYVHRVNNNINKVDVNYSGKHTDIANIGMFENEQMPCNEIDNIQNSQTKSNVVEEFNIAEKNGYIEKNNVGGTDYYQLTSKGREHINKESFVEQYEKHQYQEIIGDKPIAEVHFQGNKEDLNVFRYTNKVDISKEEVSVKEYFQACKDNEWVYEENGFIKPTEKCSNWLNQSPDLLQAKGNIKIFDENSLKNIADIYKTTASGTKAIEQSTNVASAGMKAVGTGAKVTSAGSKVAGATATTAGVASGAATAGVGTVVTISVEGAKKLVEKAQVISQQLNQQINQSQSMKK